MAEKKDEEVEVEASTEAEEEETKRFPEKRGRPAEKSVVVAAFGVEREAKLLKKRGYPAKKTVVKVDSDNEAGDKEEANMEEAGVEEANMEESKRTRETVWYYTVLLQSIYIKIR